MEKFMYTAGGYEWSAFAVYQHPRERRKFVVDTQAGCSCNYYETPATKNLEAETPLTKTQVIKEFSQWYDDQYWDHSGTKIDEMERLRSSL